MIIKRKYSVLRNIRKNEIMSAASFWSDVGIKAISCLCSMIVMTMIFSAALPVSTEVLTRIVNISAWVLIFLWTIPVARNTRRRLRDAGYTAKAYLWLLLPVIGWLIFICLLCAKSLPRKGDGTLLY